MEASSGQRGQWGSKLGFVLAAAGSAIGLGNIWRFPYKTGENGGAAFVIVYIACVVFICLPYLVAELALGRHTQRNPVGAVKSIRPRSLWISVGALGVITGFFILSYYAVVAGTSFGYIFKTLLNDYTPHEEFTSNPWLQLSLFAIFLAFTALVVYGGVQKGIERWSKVLMPVLFLLMVVLIIRGLTLPGSGKGLEFYLSPDFSKITGNTVLAALGQAFYSLSLGMGLMVTYGSYLSKKDNMISSGLYVGIFDTLIALMAGLMLFPALFASGKAPDEGPSLVFVTLPEIFKTLPMGNLIGAAFFILLSIAALTSTISLLEVPTAYFVDEKRWKRKYTVWIVVAVVFLLGIPSALSQGAVAFLGDLNVFGEKTFFGVMDFVWGNLSLALGACLLSIFIGWIWSAAKAVKEVDSGTLFFQRKLPFLNMTWGSLWGLFIRYFCPVVIIIVLLNLFEIF